MAPRTGGEWVVAALRAEGVRHVFGIPGIHNLAIDDVLLRQRDIDQSQALAHSGPTVLEPPLVVDPRWEP